MLPFSIHDSWEDFYSGSYSTSNGGTISGNVSVSRCVFQNLESHAIYCYAEKPFILIELCLFHHINSGQSDGGSFYLKSLSFGFTCCIVLYKICIYKTTSTREGNAFALHDSPSNNYLISITKCDEKTDTMGAIYTMSGYPSFSNINISYCNSYDTGFYIAYPQNDAKYDNLIFKYGTFFENDSPSHSAFYFHYENSHRVSLCNYIQKNNQGNIISVFSCTLNISDSIFIVNPKYQYIDATHLFHCNINGVIYDDTVIKGKDIFQNPIVHYETDECHTSILILDKECQIIVNSCLIRKEFIEKYHMNFIFLVITK